MVLIIDHVSVSMMMVVVMLMLMAMHVCFMVHLGLVMLEILGVHLAISAEEVFDQIRRRIVADIFHGHTMIHSFAKGCLLVTKRLEGSAATGNCRRSWLLGAYSIGID